MLIGGGGETTLERSLVAFTSQQKLLGDSPYERLSLRDRTRAAKTARLFL